MQLRYPPNPGGRVITLGSEAWGRLAEDAAHILALGAASAARPDDRPAGDAESVAPTARAAKARARFAISASVTRTAAAAAMSRIAEEG